jgi:hypothetical protein
MDDVPAYFKSVITVDIRDPTLGWIQPEAEGFGIKGDRGQEVQGTEDKKAVTA